MTDVNRCWLDHLKTSIPVAAYGYPVSMYSIALEGWRRGLDLRFINNGRTKANINYVLSSDKKEHKFTGIREDSVTKKTLNICANKKLTKNHLSKANVSIPEGKTFEKDITDNEIVSYADSIGYPLVIKPTKGWGGRGVIANIKNQKEFTNALTYVRSDLNYKEIIVEKFFDGKDYRVFVIGEKVIGAIHRIPANIIGNGINSIRQLLEEKIKVRKNNPAIAASPAKVDKEMNNILHKKGYTMNSIPSKGERVFLKSKSNISAGGDPVDVTDELTDEIKMIATSAIKAIPGLVQGGVDIIVDQNNNGVVLEVNNQPSIRTHLFPMEGKARDVPKAIIDYYFPETIGRNFSSPLYYFDVGDIFNLFLSGKATEITIPSAPEGELFATRFIISGKIKNVNYEKWVRKQAVKRNLNGYIKFLKEDRAAIIVGGEKESIKQFRDIIYNKSSKKAKVKKVIQKNRTSPIKMGFEII